MQGGAVSLNSENGSLFVDSSSFSSNTAFTAGGAVSVTEGKSVTMINATFVSNTLLWRELAAGGGFYCFLCSSVNIMSSSFARNRAAYGGGAAVLQPWQASVLSNTSFVNNVALPDPLDDMLAAANRRRRALLAAVTTPHHLSGIAAVNPQLVGGQALAAAILGPIAANVTGDSGYYTGGGGLYVSVSSVVRLQGCAFLSNTAYNGGELMACDRWRQVFALSRFIASLMCSVRLMCSARLIASLMCSVRLIASLMCSVRLLLDLHRYSQMPVMMQAIGEAQA
jgi:predicted outer membrane repeat protein